MMLISLLITAVSAYFAGYWRGRNVEQDIHLASVERLLEMKCAANSAEPSVRDPESAVGDPEVK